jgi:NADPH-dependent 2,4-dienoyl-CoA reductase/sulfur reductase-like enzyme
VDPAQVDIDDAILVDEQMQTSAGGLYAAGDACQGLNRLTGKREWMGTWGNACYQGRTAGFNMAGQYAAYAGGLPQHVSPFFDWTYAQIGDVRREGENVRTESHGNPFEGAYRVITYNDNIPVGANFFNCLNDVGEMKKAITEGLAWPLEERSLPRIV